MHKDLGRGQDTWADLTVLEEPGSQGRHHCRGWQAGAVYRLQQDVQMGLAGCLDFRATL